MKRFLISLALSLSVALTPALAAGPVYVDGSAVDAGAVVQENTTYVSLRAVTETLRPDAAVAWSGDRAAAWAEDFSLTAQPGAMYLETNGRVLFVPGKILLEDGRTLVPVRVLAEALGAEVDWDPATGSVHISSAGRPLSADEVYDPDTLYWLSRIISAESQGEPLTGKVAVGNVVLNRVESSDFPDTVYGVIFDSRWGGQFEPVRNGAIHQPPTGESVTAAKLALEGADIAGDSLYFLAPTLTSNHWIMRERSYIMTIGTHWFYR